MVFFVNQKPAYDLRIIDWSSDVCYSDLIAIFLRVPLIMPADAQGHAFQYRRPFTRPQQRHCLFGSRKSGFDVVAVNILVPDTETVREFGEELGRASCRERECQSV